jgi:hypothetical protein
MRVFLAPIIPDSASPIRATLAVVNLPAVEGGAELAGHRCAVDFLVPTLRVGMQFRRAAPTLRSVKRRCSHAVPGNQRKEASLQRREHPNGIQ